MFYAQNYDDLKPRGKPEQKVLREADNRGSVEGARSWRDLAQLSAEWLTGEQHPGSKMANLAVDIMLRLAQVRAWHSMKHRLLVA